MSKKKVSAIILTVLTLLILTSSVPPARAQFVIASWSYPDEYGQGIEMFQIYGNSTGSWVKVDGDYEYDETIVFDWNVSVAIKLKCWTWLNSTLTGAVSTNDGKNYQRHNVTVTNLAGTTVFSKQNFTYSNAYPDAAPMYYYVYEVVLDFLPDYGQLYTVTVIYEVFYL